MLRDIVKPAIILFLICLITAMLLALTYNFTKDTIAQRAVSDMEAAKQEVFPDANEFREIENIEELIAGNTWMEPVKAAFECYEGDDMKGYVYSIKVAGYGGEITMTVGISLDGTIRGVKIGENSETPGLGKKVKDPNFSSQFAGKNPGELALTVVKTGSTKVEEIDGISGATVSSKAVVRGVQAALNMTKELQGEEVDDTSGATTWTEILIKNRNAFFHSIIIPEMGGNNQ